MLRVLDYVLQEINQIIWCYAVKVESCHMCPRSCILSDFVLYWRHQRSVTAWTARPPVLSLQTDMQYSVCSRDQVIHSDSRCYCFAKFLIAVESRPWKGIALISPAQEHTLTAPCLFIFFFYFFFFLICPPRISWRGGALSLILASSVLSLSSAALLMLPWSLRKL